MSFSDLCFNQVVIQIRFQFTMKTFQELKNSHSHQILPNYQPLRTQSYYQPYPKISGEEKDGFNQSEMPLGFKQGQTKHSEIFHKGNGSASPLVFNMHSPYKTKVRRGSEIHLQTDININKNVSVKPDQSMIIKNEQVGRNLQECAKTTSTVMVNWSHCGNSSGLNGATNIDSFSEKVSPFVKRQLGKHEQSHWLPSNNNDTTSRSYIRQEEQNSKGTMYSKENKPYMEDKHSPRHHTASMLQEIQVQKRTIENFQQEIVRLNNELHGLKSKQYIVDKEWQDQGRKTKCKTEVTFFDAKKVQFLQEQNNKLMIHREKIENDLKGQRNLNTYLEQQCNYYIANFEKNLVQLKNARETIGQLEIKQENYLCRMKKQIQQKFMLMNQRQHSSERSVKEYESEIDRLRSLYETQSNTLIENEKSRQVDRSQINLLMMKLETIQTKNQNLTLAHTEFSQKLCLMFGELERGRACWQSKMDEKEKQFQEEMKKCEDKLELVEVAMNELKKKLAEGRKEQLQTKSSMITTENKSEQRQADEQELIQYVQIDKEGLGSICSLVGCKMEEGNIVNSIIERLCIQMAMWQGKEELSLHYLQLLDLFDIQCNQDSQEKILAEIKSLRDNMWMLIERVKELEGKSQALFSQNKSLKKQEHLLGSKLNEIKLNENCLEQLNKDLTQQLIALNARLYNYKLQTRNTLSLMHYDGETSIMENETFQTANSFGSQ